MPKHVFALSDSPPSSPLRMYWIRRASRAYHLPTECGAFILQACVPIISQGSMDNPLVLDLLKQIYSKPLAPVGGSAQDGSRPLAPDEFRMFIYKVGLRWHPCNICGPRPNSPFGFSPGRSVFKERASFVDRMPVCTSSRESCEAVSGAEHVSPHRLP